MKFITQSVRSEATWYTGTNVCRDGLGAEFKSPSIIQGHISRTPQPHCSSFVVYPAVPFPRTHTTLTRSMANVNGHRRKMSRLLLMCSIYYCQLCRFSHAYIAHVCTMPLIMPFTQAVYNTFYQP